MRFINPKNRSRICLTKNFEGNTNEMVIKLAHTQPEIGVFWYLDEKFLRQTQNFNETGVIPFQGKHSITASDALGNEVSVTITIE